MLRISMHFDGQGTTTLRLEGRIAGPWVDELRQTVEQSFESGPSLQIDMSGVEFIDRDGVSLFGELAARPVEVLRCPGFITELLRR